MPPCTRARPLEARNEGRESSSAMHAGRKSRANRSRNGVGQWAASAPVGERRISTVLGELWRDEVVAENVAKRVQVPRNARVDDRERVVLTDAELEAFMARPDVHAELPAMAQVSRALGRAKTSDLHACDWAHGDTVHWLDAHVPRPKTKSGDRVALPDMLVPVPRAWLAVR